MTKNQRLWVLFAVAVLMAVNNIGGKVILDLDWMTLTFANAGTFLMFFVYYQMAKKR
ncbi:MAG: hypothetical protein JW702_08975 [Clostridiales bacterium]|nr:hypothetical protein [Clostridiales bacterium]